MKEKLLRKLADKSTHRIFFHACVVTRGGAVISVGYNHGKIHAEKNALGKIWPNQRVGCKVWSIRVTRSGKLANARPCINCIAYMKHFRIKTIWFSTAFRTMEKIKLCHSKS